MSIETVTAYPPPMTSVLVRNMTSSVLVIASDPRRTHEVNFEAKGSPSGGDVQHMPQEIIRTPAFARQLALGTLEVIEGADDPGVVQAMKSQQAAYWNRAKTESASAASVLDHEPDKDFIVLACIGPGPRPGTPCGTEIPVRAADSGAKVPLCAQHEQLKERAVRRGDGPWQIEE